VLTETRCGSTHVATRWHLASRHRAPWHWVTPPGLIGERGTAVRLKLQTPLSPLLDPGFVEGALRRHFQPFLEPFFDSFLASHYSTGIALEVSWDAVLLGEVTKYFLKRALAVRTGQGHFLADLTLG